MAGNGSQTSGSGRAAGGIALSRALGMVREVLLGAVLGVGPATDAFRYAMRLPNVLQNLLGEGALGASFVPVYARLVEERNQAEARRVAGGVLGMLSATIAIVTALLVLLAGPIVSLFNPGLSPETHDLTVSLMRVTSVGVAFLGVSAWALGILNAHRQYFLGYAAPALWNLAQIGVLFTIAASGLIGDAPQPDTIVTWLAVAVVIGSIAQFAAMLPRVRVLTQSVTPHLRREGATKVVLRRFIPAVGARGVIQISSLIDGVLASFLVAGGTAIWLYALPLYLLPISIFGFSVATAELTEMSRQSDRSDVVAGRVRLGLRKVSLAAGLCASVLFFGGVSVAETLYAWPNELLQKNSFRADDALVVGWTLAGFAVALPAAMTSRVTQNALYALGDVARPAKIAVIRVAVSTIVAVLLIYQADRLVVLNGNVTGWGELPLTPPWKPLSAEIRDGAGTDGVHLGPVGIGIAAIVSSWTEWALMRAALRRRTSQPLRTGLFFPVTAAALAAGVAILAVQRLVGLPAPLEGVVIGFVALAIYIGALRFQGFHPHDRIPAASTSD